MMSKLINKMPDYFFIITTLSKGQLNKQVEKNLKEDCLYNNFKVHGVCDYTANTKLTYKDILDELPIDKNIIWLRDEGHIHTNKWQPLLEDRCYRIINISATNNDLGGIECNFKHTMMLRTVIQQCGEISDALDKLIEVKKQHSKVKDYNPCAILRCLSSDIVNIAINECIKRKLKYINITTDDYDMSDICEDNNRYDVIINKFKIVEGIDIRRAHVIWLENEPGNTKTTIQLIGRCRRNALLYRNDIDIFKSSNKKLLKDTRQCYAFYNVLNMNIDSDEDGNLVNAFCNIISCQKLKVGSIIKVENGQMENGLTISELQGESGEFEVKKNEETGFNIVYPIGDYYKKITKNIKDDFFYIHYNKIYTKIDKSAIGGRKFYLPKILKIVETKSTIGWSNQECIKKYIPISSEKDTYGNYEIMSVDLEEFKFTLNNFYKNYNIIFNDKELAILAGENYFYNKSIGEWIERKSITSLINKHCKFNTFIENKYKKELEYAKNFIYNGKNNFKLDTRCNACLGYCVEYYSKYLIYGEEYLKEYIDKAKKESKVDIIDIGIIIRACMLKYKDNMMKCYGTAIGKLIRSISIEQLIKESYKDFLNIIVKLGTQTAEFIKKNLNINTNTINEEIGELSINQIDPCLITNHFVGLCDYIDENTIIDIKTTSNITMSYVKQVLAYHYLSTKRSDLYIKEVIIYDAVKNKCVRIPISEENLK